MPLLNPETFADALVAQPRLVGHVQYPYGAVFAGLARQIDTMTKPGFKVDRPSALKLLDEIRQAVINGMQMQKGMRPWDFSKEVFTKLDRSKPWWGFEFETGWQTRNAYTQAVTHVWDNYDGCMFDSEGEGNHQVEITFCPSEQHTYFDGTAPAYKFMEWVDAHPTLSYRGGDNNVGTHLNISDPRFTTRASVDNLLTFLNRTLHFTRAVNGQREKMFGRESIYAGFFYNESNGGANKWLEFKGFRTTYKLAQFKDYLLTAAALQKVVDTFYANEATVSKKAVSNLYDIAFNGAEPQLADFKDLVVAPHARPLGTRFGGRIGDNGIGRVGPGNEAALAAVAAQLDAFGGLVGGRFVVPNF